MVFLFATIMKLETRYIPLFQSRVNGDKVGVIQAIIVTSSHHFVYSFSNYGALFRELHKDRCGTQKKTSLVKDSNGNLLICETDCSNRWQVLFQELLNRSPLNRRPPAFQKSQLTDSAAYMTEPNAVSVSTAETLESTMTCTQVMLQHLLNIFVDYLMSIVAPVFNGVLLPAHTPRPGVRGWHNTNNNKHRWH